MGANKDIAEGILKTLELYKDKEFVQRILNPNDYPVLDLGNGQYGTHKMAYAEVDGKTIAYPNIVYDKDTEALKELSSKDAIDYALKNKEFIEFKTPEEADFFTKNYKTLWGD
jgi:hypothetical protein